MIEMGLKRLLRLLYGHYFDPRVSDVANADDGSVPDSSAGADVDMEHFTLVSSGSLGEAADDAEKDEAAGAVVSGRVKKKATKSVSKVSWGKLLSQHSQVLKVTTSISWNDFTGMIWTNMTVKKRDLQK